MMEEDKERKLKTAIDNVKYLESQLTPLVENNARLKESIQALQFYMEQRRQDFASLLSIRKDRELKVNLSDMVNVYQWLQKDIENYLYKIKNIETENAMFKIFIKDQDEENKHQQDSLNQQISIQNETMEKLNQQLVQQQQQHKQDQQELCNLHERKCEQQNQKQKEVLEMKQKEYDYLNSKYQQLEDEYAQKLKKQKQELINQYDRQERQNQLEFQKQIKEQTDSITKLDIKNRQYLTELQNIKQDYSQLIQKYTQQQKSSNKLTRQVENLLSTIKSSREEIDNLIQKNEELQKQLDSLKLQIDKQTKKESELHQYIKQQKQQSIELEERMNLQMEEANNQLSDLKYSIQKKELCIKELSDMNIKIDTKCREQLTKQRIKYEQILYPNRVTTEFLYKDSEMQHDDSSFKDLIEDYELILSQYYKEKVDANISLTQQEESFNLQSQAINKIHEQQINQLTKEFDRKFNHEQRQSKQLIKELHTSKVNELEQLAQRHQSEIKQLQHQFKNQQSNQSLEIERLNSKVIEFEKVIDQLNELIVQLQDNIYSLKESHEQQLELLRRNHQIGKEQLASAFEERYNNANNELQQLKLEKEDFENQRIADLKQINEQKRKVEQCQQTILQMKDECRQYQSQINEKSLVIEQMQIQLMRQNEIVKQLQYETENSRQVYNIFRNTSMSIRQPDDQLIKTDVKKPNTSIKYSRAKKTRQIIQRPLIHNTTMQFIVSNADQQLPKMRSISNNQLRTTPRHHSSQM